jgi:hypothetical protein
MKLSREITRYFDSLTQKVFLRKDLHQILAERQKAWELRTISGDIFINLLMTMKLKELKLTSPNYAKTYTRFIWGDNDPTYQLSLSLRPHSYFTHFTAMQILGLTEQVSKIIYVNTEQSMKYDRDGELAQERIDTAFKRKTRVSKYIFTYKDWRIYCLNGTNTKNLGVQKIEVFNEGELPTTNMERTLIDIAVRPVYSGGCNEVLQAYKSAKDKVSVNLIGTMLKK